ncbi:helix-turn-helix transcriptional regulator [Nigerium massiliense]|uniref:helix-turn-helix transcriptional regulator n=1 Tax=Nigerium massiliense TaxID=1522317 RepID=UPI00058DB28A|nr:WYL domain-containing protein [Nigerium massiliense]
MPTQLAAEATPVARALRALEAIQDRPGITAAALAERLGVSERAVRRYVATLRDGGVPIESTGGRFGGYRLGRGARLAPVVFTEDEAIALVTSVLSVTAGRRSSDPRMDALDKVIRALPAPARQVAAGVRDSATGTGAPDPLPQPAVTTTVVGAITRAQVLELAYRSEQGNERAWRVDPWALVVRHGRWYLLCRAHHADAVRTLRIDRIIEARMVEERCVIPDGLDAGEALERALGEGWRYDVRVFIEAPPDEVAPRLGSASGTLVAVEGGCELRGSTRNPWLFLCERLAPIPVPWRVLGGEEMRDAARDLAARLDAAAR